MPYRLKALLLALAIGGTTVIAATLAIAIPFGVPLALSEEWRIFLIQMLLVALPFLALALLAERSRASGDRRSR